MSFLKALLRWFSGSPSEGPKLTPIEPTEPEGPPRCRLPPSATASKPPDNPPPYRVFTREFDRVIHARDLDKVLGPLTSAQATAAGRAVFVFQRALEGWRTRVRLHAAKVSDELSRNLPATALANTSVTLLIDQSGSMRGRSMRLATAAVDVALNFLHGLGCSVEILGFTTVAWKGGRSREKWLEQGKPPQPGRLSDLLHIIHRSADTPKAGADEWDPMNMLRPDLLKENIDGEALEWAAQRLRARPERNKVLLVISDGAPVDDSTLAANDGYILDRHLRQVIAALQDAGDIHLGAAGVGYEVGRHYATAMKVATAGDLGEALIDLLEDVLLLACIDDQGDARTLH